MLKDFLTRHQDELSTNVQSFGHRALLVDCSSRSSFSPRVLRSQSLARSLLSLLFALCFVVSNVVGLRVAASRNATLAASNPTDSAAALDSNSEGDSSGYRFEYIDGKPRLARTGNSSTPNAPLSLTNITGPVGSGAFGTTVTVLPNGNIVVTDPQYDITSPATVADVGAVYLYDNATLALISTLTGSTADDFVGSGDITVLTNGNFVVRSTNWNNPTGPIAQVGAVTFCNATTGLNGVVSGSNSLIGARPSDFVGYPGVNLTPGVIPLTNGNYVVISSLWDNPSPVIADVGAVTLCNGTTGRTGTVSSANSIVGSTASDKVGSSGVIGEGCVTALPNGNYVVRSALWSKPSPLTANVGAVTWGDGTAGAVGAVSSANSLIGGTAS